MKKTQKASRRLLVLICLPTLLLTSSCSDTSLSNSAIFGMIGGGALAFLFAHKQSVPVQLAAIAAGGAAGGFLGDRIGRSSVTSNAR